MSFRGFFNKNKKNDNITNVLKNLATKKSKEEKNDEVASLFQKRQGGDVKFYSDGYDENGETGAFCDMFSAMHNAEESILIAGWTLSPTESFHYYATNENGESIRYETTLPELLAEKAVAGKDVVLMIWKNIVPDFKGETENFMPILREKVMKIVREKLKKENKIIDESDTKNIAHFEKIVKARTNAAMEKVSSRFTNTKLTYSDHAKMLIVDSKTLFAGGLDITVNRNNRQIWHDDHFRVTGSTVKDALDLFARRFKRHTIIKEKYRKGIEALEKAKLNWKDITPKEDIEVNNDADPNKKPFMQLLTSLRKEYINSDNLEFDWKKGTHTQELLNTQIKAIKKAENFIYMENQFFVGPHYREGTKDSVEGPNLVIVEMVNKIKEKIEKGENFHFYCQLPYRPEGDHKDLVVNAILREQWKTMDWVMSEVEKAINDKKINDPNFKKSTSDYLTFSNLGFQKPGKNTENGFEMKYTHSKLMIIDDKTAFMGSNNCNERSNKGNRDHEICVYFENMPKKVGNYRRQLMKQHFGEEDCFNFDNKSILPNDPRMYKAIHDKLDANLENLKQQKAGKIKIDNNDNKPCSTPWGNIPTNKLLNERKRPSHVPASTHKVVSAVQATIQPLKKFTR